MQFDQLTAKLLVRIPVTLPLYSTTSGATVNHPKAKWLVVIDLIEAKPGREMQLAQELREVISVEREAALVNGASFFELYEGETDPSRFTIVQHWNDRETFERFHKEFAPQALRDFVSRADELLARPVSEIASFWNPMFD